MSDFLERLKNKITYYVYKTVNDDDANQYADQKKKQEEAKQEEPLKSEDKEQYTAAPLASATDTFEDTDTLNLSLIGTQVWNYLVYFFKIGFFPLLSVYLASLIANELIMYPPAIRFVFFVFTLFSCLTNTMIAGGVGIFYGGKKIYEKYVNREREGKPNPPIRIMPRIFGILPLTTYESESSITNFFLYPFRYLKGITNEKDTKLLETIMKEYKNSLDESFPYYEKIKGEAQFVARKKEMDKMIDTMHEKQINPEYAKQIQDNKFANNAVEREASRIKSSTPSTTPTPMFEPQAAPVAPVASPPPPAYNVPKTIANKPSEVPPLPPTYNGKNQSALPASTQNNTASPPAFNTSSTPQEPK